MSASSLQVLRWTISKCIILTWRGYFYQLGCLAKSPRVASRTRLNTVRLVECSVGRTREGFLSIWNATHPNSVCCVNASYRILLVPRQHQSWPISSSRRRRAGYPRIINLPPPWRSIHRSDLCHLMLTNHLVNCLTSTSRRLSTWT